MAVKWNKIYRGGVQSTTPETREIKAPATGSLQPGMGATISAAGVLTLVAATDQFIYFVGEPMHGTVDDQLAGATADTVRMYSPHSGDLYAARVVAGVALVDDAPLTLTASGQFKAAVVGTDKVHCYVDNPASAHPGTTPATSVLNQLIPVKIK